MGFQVRGTLTVNHGDVCIDPLCIEIKDEPVTTTIDLVWQPQRVRVHHFDYTHTNVMTIQGSGDFTLGEQWDINTLSVQLIRTSLKQLYTHYLQGLLDEDSKFNDLETGGQIKIKLDWNKNNQQVIAQLDNVNVEDQKKRFGLQGIRGKIQWHSKAKNLPSHLRWSSAYLASNKIKLGASQWRANFSGDRIRLLAPWYQPILDGAIRIEQFRLENIGKHKTWQLGGKLYPVSLQTLSSALDGPLLSGQISVDMPLVNYRNNRVDIDGKLRMRIFDGDIIVHSLSLHDPFGEAPVLEANIDITNINLETLTSRLEFGKIQGQLSGYIHQLRLVNWEPESFDAYFATPEDDKMPHKISQKAIKKLSNLGGGAAANAISYSVLNIFEEFHYQRMGLGCRLKDGVCKMRGVGRIHDGYYIIKGSWLPRIDMIGYDDNKSVNWNELLDRIKTVINTADVITNSNTPVIE